MCGIVGFNWKDEKSIKEMVEIIKHRGPDHQGVKVDRASIGNVRLAIIDTSTKGNQPMTRGDLTIVYNGEIYNYKEIRQQLKEYKFQSDSDTEVILRAYQKWGDECLHKFNGMFAFAIYDKKKEQLFLARDRYGIKPLYYYEVGGKFVFASEIKAILWMFDRKKIKKEIDMEGFSQFFTFRFTLGETTLVKDVKKLLPGHCMLYDLKNKKIKWGKKYYELKKQPVLDRPFKYYVKKVREALEKSVERRMVADVPVAVLLSGGVDSSIITGLAKKHNPKLNTFSIGFDKTDETKYAKIVADHFETIHHEFRMEKDDMLNYLDKMVYHMDEPIGDPGFLPIMVLSKAVKKYNKVVLSGDGGDEVFLGYDRYKMLHYGKSLRKFMFFNSDNEILKKLKDMRDKDDYTMFFEIIRLFDSEDLKKLGVRPFNARSYWKRNYKAIVTNAQEFDINTLLPNDFFMKADKMSSAFGLEQRVPFLDHEVVELAFQIPVKHKLRGWNEKYVLREAFRGFVPDVITARRKHGFNVPIDYWFTNVLSEKLITLLEKSDHGLYNKEHVLTLLDLMHQKADNNYKESFIVAQKLWSILMFEMWYNEFMK